MTENTKPELERPGPISQGIALDGEIVGLEETRVRIRLATDAIGFLARMPDQADPTPLQLGQRGLFRVLASNEGEDTLLSLVSISDSASEPLSFEHDVDRLQSALTLHHPTSITRDEVVPTLDERHIQQWLDRVEKSLEKLRRNRAKRLDEEFYSRS
ncbi:hypothetical protein IH601_08955 [Candidatus Bipolaricaulota bacterium]|nr:hypothetical protein [Candidatus Bipolaricaulota bacterium]TFH11837.1 MAG: hypothetical protein E4H08_00085 [Candidatus Atribacteria bacterium]